MLRTTVYACGTCLIASDPDTPRASRALRDDHRAVVHGNDLAVTDAVRLAPALREVLVQGVVVLCGAGSGVLLHDVIAALV
ncbi:hypothetical protein ACFVWE_31910 [Streptomyces albidoflavus]